MKSVTLNVSAIRDLKGFHDLFASALKFPSYYGRNMDAWIDCIGDVAGDAGGLLVLNIEGAAKLKGSCPEIFAALNECSAFVNFREIEAGRPPVICLAYHA